MSELDPSGRTMRGTHAPASAALDAVVGACGPSERRMTALAPALVDEIVGLAREWGRRCRGRLRKGTTWHAAGFAPMLRSLIPLTKAL
jgi:hypothetical protein